MEPAKPANLFNPFGFRYKNLSSQTHASLIKNFCDVNHLDTNSETIRLVDIGLNLLLYAENQKLKFLTELEIYDFLRNASFAGSKARKNLGKISEYSSIESVITLLYQPTEKYILLKKELSKSIRKMQAEISYFKELRNAKDKREMSTLRSLLVNTSYDLIICSAHKILISLIKSNISQDAKDDAFLCFHKRINEMADFKYEKKNTKTFQNKMSLIRSQILKKEILLIEDLSTPNILKIKIHNLTINIDAEVD